MHIPDSPLNTVESAIFGVVALLSAMRVAKRILKDEFYSKRCAFCGNLIPADEHAHHLEMCGLKKLGGRAVN